MKVNQFLKKMTSNWPAKLVCFVMALFLYLFHQLSTVERRILDVPLTVKENGAVVKAGDVPSSVRVIIRGTNHDINNIQRSAFKATLNLDYLAEAGRFDVPVTLDIANELLAYDPLEIRVRPEFVSLKVDSRVSEPVPVVPDIIGTVAHGYELKSFEIEPTFVNVIGGNEIVSKISQIKTDTIDVSGISKNTTFGVQLHNVNKMIQLENDSSYKVKVLVEPVVIQQMFEKIPVKYSNLLNTLQIDSIVSYVDVELSGNLLTMEKFNSTLINVYVDLSSVFESGEYDLPVVCRIPGSVSVVSTSMDVVHVVVTEKPIESHPEEESAADI